VPANNQCYCVVLRPVLVIIYFSKYPGSKIGLVICLSLYSNLSLQKSICFPTSLVGICNYQSEAYFCQSGARIGQPRRKYVYLLPNFNIYHHMYVQVITKLGLANQHICTIIKTTTYVERF
jgi:hypothetical protein